MSKIRARDGSACDGGPAVPAINPNHQPRLPLVNYSCVKYLSEGMTRLHFTIQPVTQHPPQKPHISTNRTLLSASVSAIQSHVYYLAPLDNPISHPISPDAFQTHLPPCLHVEQGTGNRDIQTPTHPNAMPTRDHTNPVRSLHLVAEKHHCSSSSSSSSEFGCCGQCDGLGTADGSSDGNGFRPQTTYLVWRQQHPFHHS
jgi:hypothetical protein